MMRPWLLAVTCIALAPLTAAAQAGAGEDLPVREVTLDNGLRILALPRAGAPTVSFVVRYGVGSVDEHPGLTGISHLLEHLLFKGTTTIGTRNHEAERRLFRRMDAVHDTLVRARDAVSPDSTEVLRLTDWLDALEDSARTLVVSNEFDRILGRHGARGLNATTTADATTYFVELPANRLELWFALEADRMLNAVFREFHTERDVVMEERRMRVETSPDGLLYEAHLAAAFTVHPYRVPTVGYMSDLERLSRGDAEAWYRRYYGPSNAIVAVVGDVDPDRVEALARSYLGRIPAGEPRPPVLADEPPQRGQRRVVVRYDAEPRLRIGWHVPEALHPDAPALTMLSAILTGGRTSRLYRRLVLEERSATTVVSSAGPGERHPRLFQLAVTPRAPRTTAEVEAAVLDELDRLRREPPTADELERVRTGAEAGAVRGLASNLGLALRLAGAASLYGDWRAGFRASQRLEDVTPADVQHVVDRYLRPENRTVAVLERPRAPDGGR